MSGPGSVTGWLDRHAAGVRGGGEARLWERYFSRLVALAGQHLRSRARGGDEAEMALSAFDAFVRAGSAGRFPRLGGADDLWRGVLAMAARKAEDASRNPARGKQGGSQTTPTVGVSVGPDLSGPSADPDPAEAVALAEGLGGMLAALKDPLVRAVAFWALEGYTPVEIAGKMGRSVATAERRLKRVWTVWGEQASSGPPPP